MNSTTTTPSDRRIVQLFDPTGGRLAAMIEAKKQRRHFDAIESDAKRGRQNDAGESARPANREHQNSRRQNDALKSETRDTDPNSLTPDELQAIETAKAQGYYTRSGRRLRALLAWRAHCQATGRTCVTVELKKRQAVIYRDGDEVARVARDKADATARQYASTEGTQQAFTWKAAI